MVVQSKCGVRGAKCEVRDLPHSALRTHFGLRTSPGRRTPDVCYCTLTVTLAIAVRLSASLTVTLTTYAPAALKRCVLVGDGPTMSGVVSPKVKRYSTMGDGPRV